MRILLLGGSGQVGSQLRATLAPLGEVIAPARASGWDLSDPVELAARVEQLAPEVIVNAAAYTAVDRAEAEPALAHRVNAEAPAALAAAARSLDAWLIHYSTDYVFDGRGSRPWCEDDPTGPLGVYGQSKLAGERAIAARHARHLIFRTSWVHGPHGANFIRTMLRLAGERDSLAVVNDQIGAPTGAPLIAHVTAQAIARVTAPTNSRTSALASALGSARVQQAPDLAGTYHLAAGGETSWWDVACLALSEARQQGAALRCGPEQVAPIPTTQYPTPAQRPLNSRLNTRKLREAFGLALPAWQDGVRQTVQSLLASGTPLSSAQG